MSYVQDWRQTPSMHRSLFLSTHPQKACMLEVRTFNKDTQTQKTDQSHNIHCTINSYTAEFTMWDYAWMKLICSFKHTCSLCNCMKLQGSVSHSRGVTLIEVVVWRTSLVYLCKCSHSSGGAVYISSCDIQIRTYAENKMVENT